MIPNQLTLYLALGTLICLVAPVALLVVYCKRRACSAFPALAGAVAFLVAYGLESWLILELLRAPGIGPLLTATATGYALFFALMTGLFEETARFAVLRALHRRGGEGETAVTYCLGHAGCEAVLVLGVTYAATLAFALYAAVRGLNVATAVFQLSPGSVEALTSQPPLDYLAAVVERVSALALHAANTALIWLAVSRRGMAGLYPTAIATHAIFNLGVAFFRYGATSSVWGVECYTAVAAVATCALAWRLRQWAMRTA